MVRHPLSQFSKVFTKKFPFNCLFLFLGSYWGEDGFFRIKMHEDNLGIEKECDWGIPTMPK